jgi:hypothetical protein
VLLAQFPQGGGVRIDADVVKTHDLGEDEQRVDVGAARREVDGRLTARLVAEVADDL